MDLIKQGRYQEAVTHFQNLKKAQSIGLQTGDPLLSHLKTLPAPDRLDSYIEVLTAHCHSKPLEVTVLWLDIPTQELNDPQAQLILTSIHQNLSLAGAEEWIHNLQDAEGKLLTEAPNKEIDVAVYLVQNGVTLTDQFLNRYKRRKYLESSTPTPLSS